MHVLLDADMLAILLAARQLEVVGITTVSGNQSIEKVTRNALVIVEMAGLTSIPVSRGLPRPLVNEAVYAPEIHGETGLDGVVLPDPVTPLSPLGAVDFILDASRRHDDLWLVPTGPLTNVAAALIADPALAGRLAGISLMGGSLTYGNSTPAAEFNIWVDPEAADVVFRSGVPIRMFGLNVTRQVNATQTEIGRIRDIGRPVAKTVADLLEFYRSSLEKVFGLTGASLHDPLAVATLIRPELFELQKMHVGIELHGTRTRGMTVCDYRYVGRGGGGPVGRDAIGHGETPNAEVAVAIDVPGFFDLLLETLVQY
jgi:inosine-uridine nucleoside N-ribohydrolase